MHDILILIPGYLLETSRCSVDLDSEGTVVRAAFLTLAGWNLREDFAAALGRVTDPRLRRQLVRRWRSIEASQVRKSEEYAALAEAWDETRLCIGDQTSDAAMHLPGHSNRWNLDGVCRLAFSSLGAVLPHHSRPTHRMIDAIVAVASAGDGCSQIASN